MVKTESTSSKSGDNEGTLPTWAEEEIKSVQFGQPENPYKNWVYP